MLEATQRHNSVQTVRRCIYLECCCLQCSAIAECEAPWCIGARLLQCLKVQGALLLRHTTRQEVNAGDSRWNTAARAAANSTHRLRCQVMRLRTGWLVCKCIAADMWIWPTAADLTSHAAAASIHCSTHHWRCCVTRLTRAAWCVWCIWQPQQGLR